MKYLLIENEKGQYIGKDGKRYDILECEYAVGPRADGFVDFESLEEALKTWGLTEVEDAYEN